MINLRSILLTVLLCLVPFSCRQKEDFRQHTIPEACELTAEEIEKGLLTPEILWKFGRLGDFSVSPDKRSVAYSLTWYDYKNNGKSTAIYRLDLPGGKSIRLTGTDDLCFHPRWLPSGKKIGFLSDRSGSVQLWEMEPDGSGQAPVSNIEGGINSFEYSPTGGHLYYTKDVRIDAAPEEIYPDLPHANARIIDDLMYRHWDSWHDYACSHIFISDYSEGILGEGRDIMEEEPWDAPMSPFFDHDEISWSPDGSFIAYTCKKMKGIEYALSTNSDIFLYSVESGTTGNISRGMPGYDRYPSFSPGGEMIAWQSMETPGYEADKDRLLVMDLQTREIRDLTEDFDRNADHITWSDNNRDIYFISGIRATYQVCKVNAASGEITGITKGRHDYMDISLLNDRILGKKMSMSMAPELFAINPHTGWEEQLTFINRHIYDHVEFGQVEERWIKTTDNKEMLVWVIYPPGFDPSMEYPALLYCQGGPQSAVSQFFSFRWNFQMMAADNYIVVAPNRRGLPTFGQEWNEQISGDYGGQNMKDYLSAIDTMKTELFVDENRLGAVGASYGGYSVFWLAGHHEERFSAFISHCGIYNLESMYGATEEMFFVNYDLGGPYWESPRPASYDFSPHLYVQEWDTPILIITGARDFRVTYTQSLEAFNAARLRGINAKLLFFPEESHFVLQPQNGILWHREFFKWLDQWLK